MSEKKKYKLSPKEYSAILNKLDIGEIHLVKNSAKVDRAKLGEKNKISINDKAKFEQTSKDIATIHHTYKLLATNNGDEFLKIEATFCVILRDASEASKDFFEIYKDMSLPMTTWPFFREFVNNTTARMGIQPLTIPLIKRPGS